MDPVLKWHRDKFSTGPNYNRYKQSGTNEVFSGSGSTSGSGLDLRANILKFNSVVLSVVDDVPVNSEPSVVISIISEFVYVHHRGECACIVSV